MRTRLALGVVLVLVLVLVIAGALWLVVDDAGAEGATAEYSASGEGGWSDRAWRERTASPTPTGEADEVEPARALRPQANTLPAPDSGVADAATFEAMAEFVLADAVKAWLRTNAAAAEKHVDRYCAETKRIGNLEAVAERPRTRDAAIFMAGKSDWENGIIGALHLSDVLTERMKNPPMNWRNFGPADYAGLDFTWMHELLAYDHWSLTGDGPLKNQEAIGWDDPLPNYIILQFWVKLRLIKGRNEGDLAQASLEVRHLGDLCASSGTLVGEMIRGAMFGMERKVWEDAGLTPPVALPSIDDVQRIRHASFAGMYFLMPGVPRAVSQKALACTPTRCVAINEAISSTAAFRDLDPNAREDLEWLQAQGPCDPETAARFARGPAQPTRLLFESYSGEMGVERSMGALLAVDGGTWP